MSLIEKMQGMGNSAIKISIRDYVKKSYGHATVEIVGNQDFVEEIMKTIQSSCLTNNWDLDVDETVESYWSKDSMGMLDKGFYVQFKRWSGTGKDVAKDFGTILWKGLKDTTYKKKEEEKS